MKAVAGNSTWYEKESADNNVIAVIGIPLVTSLYLLSMNHDYHAVVRVFGPPRMYTDLFLPPSPPNVSIETNGEALIRIGRDLTLVANEQFSTTVLYRRFGFDEGGQSYK